MYIEPSVILLLLALLGVVALVYFICTLSNLNKLIKNIDNLLTINTKDITESVSMLPNVMNNFTIVGENMRDVSEFAVDVTADVIVTKENIKSNIDLGLGLVDILKNLFISK